jgi:hypothetical protein
MKNGQNLVIVLVIKDRLYTVQCRPVWFLGAHRVIRVLGCSGGRKMKNPVDIFWFGESGPVWVEAAQTMEHAKACLDALPLKTSGGYAVVDQRTGNRMSFEPNLRYGRRSGWRTEKSSNSRV